MLKASAAPPKPPSGAGEKTGVVEEKAVVHALDLARFVLSAFPSPAAKAQAVEHLEQEAQLTAPLSAEMLACACQ